MVSVGRWLGCQVVNGLYRVVWGPGVGVGEESVEAGNGMGSMGRGAWDGGWQALAALGVGGGGGGAGVLGQGGVGGGGGGRQGARGGRVGRGRGEERRTDTAAAGAAEMLVSCGGGVGCGGGAVY